MNVVGRSVGMSPQQCSVGHACVVAIRWEGRRPQATAAGRRQAAVGRYAYAHDLHSIIVHHQQKYSTVSPSPGKYRTGGEYVEWRPTDNAYQTRPTIVIVGIGDKNVMNSPRTEEQCHSDHGLRAPHLGVVANSGVRRVQGVLWVAGSGKTGAAVYRL